MNKKLIIISIIGILSLSNADYTVKVPLEQNNGGNLPNGSINLTGNQTPPVPNNSWITIPSIESSWEDDGFVFNCSGEWLPQAYTVRINEFFSQTANNCSQNQFRTVQEREQNTETNEIRNKGDIISENRTLSNILGERDAYGILDCSYDSGGNYWTGDDYSWEIFFQYNYVGDSVAYGDPSLREVTYTVYKLSRGNLIERNNYELCHYQPDY